MKKVIIRIILLAVVVAAAYGGFRALRLLPERQAQIATTRVRQGDVVVRTYTRGELRAVRSATLSAPNLFGTVQVTRISPLGAFAREKDLVVEFDDSEVNSRLEEKQLELDQIEEQIKKSQADLSMRTNQDQVELLSAQYAVRRADLEVKRNELLSNIDAKKNELNLEEAKRKLKQLESDIKSRRQQAEAELAVLREKKNKALLELQRERARLLQVKLLSPMSGLVAIRQNRTGFMFPGMQIPDIREGDQVQPGMPVADVLDLSEMEVVAKVGELDRANLGEGQEAMLSLDALPEKKLHARIKSMSGTASSNVFSFDPAKKFDVVFSIDMKELLSALGAKPEQIQKILATAEQNRRKPAPPGGSSFMMASGGPVVVGGGGSAMPVSGAAAPQGSGNATFGTPGAVQAGQAGQGGEGGQRRMVMAGGAGEQQAMTPEQQQKMREAFQKALNGRNPQDLSQEERQQIFQKIRAEVTKASGGAATGKTGQQGGRETRGSRPDAGPGAGPAGQGLLTAGPGGPAPAMTFAGGSRYSEKDLERAQLPPPPEEDTQFDVLLRPGLLADVEITVEKIPNAIHVPMQAVFEREGQPIVYVKKGNAFEPRVIKPLKRSESTMVIADGVKPNEIIALADPTAKPGEKGKKAGSKSGSGAMGALPGGGTK